jgi:hypothetical protein
VGLGRDIFAFNGDGDGLCALQQLRWAESAPADVLVTGTKRDTALVERVEAGPGDRLTVLDVSFHANREAVGRVLEHGAAVRYFDHHHAGDLPCHPNLHCHIDTAADTCTSLIVDKHLCGAHRRWAVVGAFADNLAPTARRLAGGLGLCEGDIDALERLGVGLNYNAYGETEDDLFFRPHELHLNLAAYRDPLDFVAAEKAFAVLCDGYAADIARAVTLQPEASSPQAALYRLPQTKWARRVSGVFANRLACEAPHRAHALLVPKSKGGFLVSVRAPRGAAALCMEFPTGGGRAAAAGINHLDSGDAERFVRRFLDYFTA